MPRYTCSKESTRKRVADILELISKAGAYGIPPREVRSATGFTRDECRTALRHLADTNQVLMIGGRGKDSRYYLPEWKGRCIGPVRSDRQIKKMERERRRYQAQKLLPGKVDLRTKPVVQDELLTRKPRIIPAADAPRVEVSVPSFVFALGGE